MFNRSLKSIAQLKRHQVPEEALDRGRIRLQAYMAVRPMIRPAVQPSWFARAFLWKPMVAGMVAAVALSGAGGAVYASESSLPGDALYRVKRWSEEVRAKLALSADSKFWVRAEQAERRLTEAEAVMHVALGNKNGEDKRAARLQLAMDAYAAHVVAMGKNAPESTAAMLVVDRVLDRHESLVETTIEAKARATVIGPIVAAIELEDHLQQAVSARQEDANIRVRERIERLLRNRVILPPGHDKNGVAADAHVDHGGSDGNHDHGGHEHVDVDDVREPSEPMDSTLRDTGLKAGIQSDLNLKLHAEPGNGIFR